jgi:hypothetical protein
MPKADAWMLRIGLIIAFMASIVFLTSGYVPIPYAWYIAEYGTVISSVLAAFVLVRGAFPRLRGK